MGVKYGKLDRCEHLIELFFLESEKMQVITETITKKQKKERDLTNRQLAYALLRKEGATVENAGAMAGYNKKYAYMLEKNVSKKYDLTSEKWLGKAEKALKCVIEGGIVGEASKPKTSDVMRAVEMVYDRAQPIVHRNESVNVTAQIDLVDLSKYMRGGGVSVDDEPTSVQTEPVPEI